MKKYLLLFILTVVFISYSSAQYSLSWEGETLGDTVLVAGEPSEFELEFHAILTNNGDDTDSIKVRRRLIHLIDGVIHYYCWGACYQPNTDSITVSSLSVELEPGASSGEFDFSGHYQPNNQTGTSWVEYTFFNIHDENESITVVAQFTTEYVGLHEGIMKEGYVSEVYPNPATHMINFDYQLTPQVSQASVKVINLLGEVVKDVNFGLGSNNKRIDVSDLSNGVYFCSIMINGEIYETKKLVVQK
jgi:hypothetical protein